MEWLWHYIFGEDPVVKGDAEVEKLVPMVMEFEQASLRRRSWCIE